MSDYISALSSPMRAADRCGFQSAIGLETVDVTPGVARRVADSHARWGKGFDPAGLDFGDCFAYEVATAHDCPLLYVGADFSRTDVESVL